MALPEPTATTPELARRVDGDSHEAWSELLAMVHDELHRIASRLMRAERADHTLQPTALINEAYLKLARAGGGAGRGRWKDRDHFLAAASIAMRQVLTDHARAARRQKRGAGRRRIPLDPVLIPFEERSLGLIELDDALERLRRSDPLCSEIVTLRFFGGLTFSRIAALLRISESTARREWEFARAWLHRELG